MDLGLVPQVQNVEKGGGKGKREIKAKKEKWRVRKREIEYDRVKVCCWVCVHKPIDRCGMLCTNVDSEVYLAALRLSRVCQV